MKRKTIDELFNNLQITKNNKKKKTEHEEKIVEKVYTQIEVDNLLTFQQEILFNEFKKYVESMRTTVDIQIPNWTY